MTLPNATGKVGAFPVTPVPAQIPTRAGVGLKPVHYREILNSRPQIPEIGWFEVHAENYMGAGGPPLQYLETLRLDYPLSLHGIGLSLGGADDLDPRHLARLKELIDRFEPGLVSEHLSWCTAGGVFLNDLLPLPYLEESLEVVCAHVSETQDFLGRPILIENPSTYLAFKASTMTEPEFLTEVVRRTGCGLLLDVNNIYVSAENLGFDAMTYMDSLPTGAVGEIHLAGHDINRYGDEVIRIDTHGSKICDAVWALYDAALHRLGPVATLIEWDTDVPALKTLAAEAGRAETLLSKHRAASLPLKEKSPHAGVA
jgi:hypothetical protein